MYKTWLFKFVIAVDVFFCSILWRDANITISSAAGLELRKSHPKWWARALRRLLGKAHCEDAIRFDRWKCHEALKLLGDA